MRTRGRDNHNILKLLHYKFLNFVFIPRNLAGKAEASFCGSLELHDAQEQTGDAVVSMGEKEKVQREVCSYVALGSICYYLFCTLKQFNFE